MTNRVTFLVDGFNLYFSGAVHGHEAHLQALNGSGVSSGSGGSKSHPGSKTSGDDGIRDFSISLSVMGCVRLA